MSTRGQLGIMVIGIVVGVLLGPWCLGRTAPQRYDRWFFGTGETTRELDGYDRKANDVLERLANTGATAAAVAEEQHRMDRERERILEEIQNQRDEYLKTLLGRTQALIVAMISLMVIEGIFSPSRATPQTRGTASLATARYALTAVWLALTLAQPALLTGVSVLFVILLVGVSLAGALRTGYADR